MTLPGGAPHLVPVWFVIDGDQVVFTIPASSAKGRNIRRAAGPVTPHRVIVNTNVAG